MTPTAIFDPERLRPYRPADLPAVLAFVGECNVRSGGCGNLHPGDIAHFMSNTLRGRDLGRHLYLYEDASGTLHALAVIYTARDAAYNLVIHPDERGGERERDLIAWCEWATAAILRDANADATTISTDVMDCDAARSELLSSGGYAPTGAYTFLHTTRSLEEPIPPSVLPEGFTIRSVAGEHEVEAVCAVHDGSFTPKWTRDEYLAVMRTPGFEIERELVVVAPDGRFAAFLIYWLDPVSRSGLFEPVGCHREFQRRGLGKALMYEGMRRMVAAGMQTAIVLHLADNPPAAALYRSAGFRPVYTVTPFSKPIPA